jgi:hypothetical protein
MAPPKPPSGQNIPVLQMKPPSGANIPIPQVKPPSNQNIPVGKPAAPERKRKRRTGVRMPEPVAAPVSPPPANPLDFTSSAPAPAPALVPSGRNDQFDVELVNMPLTPPAPSGGGFRRILRDLLMVGIGIVLMLVVYGIWTVVSLIRDWLAGS